MTDEQLLDALVKRAGTVLLPISFCDLGYVIAAFAALIVMLHEAKDCLDRDAKLERVLTLKERLNALLRAVAEAQNVPDPTVH